MLNTIKNQLTDRLALARPAFRSFEAMLMHGTWLSLVPATVKPSPAVPGNARGRQVRTVSCDRGYEAIAAISANAAVRMHADPVTEGWRSPDFGTTPTGNTGHSQSSRFAT